MSRTVSFSFDTDAEKQEFELYAKAKGMTLSQLAKFSIYQYKAKYKLKRHGFEAIRGNIQEMIEDAMTVRFSRSHGINKGGL